MTEIIDGRIRHPGEAACARELAPYFARMGKKLKGDFAFIHNQLFEFVAKALTESGDDIRQSLTDQAILDADEVEAVVTQISHSKTISIVLASSAAGGMQKLSWMDISEHIEPLQRFFNRQGPKCPLYRVLLILAQACEYITDTGIGALACQLKLITGDNRIAASGAMVRAMLGVPEANPNNPDLEAPFDINAESVWQEMAPMHCFTDIVRYGEILEAGLALMDVIADNNELGREILRASQIITEYEFGLVMHHLQPIRSLTAYIRTHPDELRSLAKNAPDSDGRYNMRILSEFELSLLQLDVSVKMKLTANISMLLSMLSIWLKVPSGKQSVFAKEVNARCGHDISSPFFKTCLISWLMVSLGGGRDYSRDIAVGTMTMSESEKNKLGNVLEGWDDDDE